MRKRPTILLLPLAVLVAALFIPAVAFGAAKQTHRVNVSSAGAQANGSSGTYPAALSSSGRYVSFESGANNLVAGDNNTSFDVFVRDRTLHKTVLASVSSAGVQGNSDSYDSSISANGRFVAFTSNASTLVSGDTNAFTDVFVRDLKLHKTYRVSVGSGGAQGNNASFGSAISANGRYVAFVSDATNLVSGDTNAAADVFVRDLKLHKTYRVSVSSSGAQGGSTSGSPAISPTGRYVAFDSSAANLVSGDTNGVTDVFVRDRSAHKTSRVSVGSAGAQGNGPSDAPAISTTGRYVAFESAASNLVGGDTNGFSDVFVRDRTTHKTSRASVSSAGVQGNNNSATPAISSDGRFVTFASFASTLVKADTNNSFDVFLRDRTLHKTYRVSVDSAGVQGDQGGLQPAISANGAYVGFVSFSTNLVPGDTNDFYDIFVRGSYR